MSETDIFAKLSRILETNDFDDDVGFDVGAVMRSSHQDSPQPPPPPPRGRFEKLFAHFLLNLLEIFWLKRQLQFQW